jgi:hypothetical protein
MFQTAYEFAAVGAVKFFEIVPLPDVTRDGA